MPGNTAAGNSASSIIAVIPARGGSKRLLNKNIYPFLGKPLLSWTIDAVRRAGIFDRILVSTDSPEIAKVAVDEGLEVPFLREAAADDFAPVSEATLWTLRKLEALTGERAPNVFQFLPTCPLLTAPDIVRAWEYFSQHEHQFQISAFKYGFMKPWAACRLNEDNVPERLFPEAYEKRTQDMPTLYCPSGAIWVADRDALEQSGTFYGPQHRYLEIPWQAGLDIDDAEDVALAEAVAATYLHQTQ